MIEQAIRAFAVACAGTETQNSASPFVSFKDSGCKKENGTKAIAARNGFGDAYDTVSQPLVSTSQRTKASKPTVFSVSRGKS
jgi:hypothetical protein